MKYRFRKQTVTELAVVAGLPVPANTEVTTYPDGTVDISLPNRTLTTTQETNVATALCRVLEGKGDTLLER